MYQSIKAIKNSFKQDGDVNLALEKLNKLIMDSSIKECESIEQMFEETQEIIDWYAKLYWRKKLSHYKGLKDPKSEEKMLNYFSGMLMVKAFDGRNHPNAGKALVRAFSEILTKKEFDTIEKEAFKNQKSVMTEVMTWNSSIDYMSPEELLIEHVEDYQEKAIGTPYEQELLTLIKTVEHDIQEKNNAR